MGKIPIGKLRLDPLNPRLPERVQGGDQDELLGYLYENDVLDELAASFVTNRFFENEPLLVLPADEDGSRVVVEGNRRVGALMILLQEGPARDAGISFTLKAPMPAEVRASLSAIPCMEVADRDELGSYLGYRHIGGIREWPAESKARWIHESVMHSVAVGSRDPFYETGRRVGSNARGVRSAFIALETLRHAREEHGIDTAFVERNRYSVWGLVVGNPILRGYLNLDDSARSFADVVRAIAETNGERLAEIIGDLTPKPGQKRALLPDSRRVSTYAAVLTDKRAVETLREYDDLELAASVLEQGAFGSRLADLVRLLEVLLLDAARLNVDAEAAAAAGNAAKLAQSLAAVVQSRLESS